jgi:hypothetical protein
MVDVTLPNGQVLSMPSVTDPEQAKRIAANYFRKNFAAPAEIDRSGVKDYGIRNYLAKADNDEEYRLRLGRMGFTPDMYVADPQGGYALNLDAIPANLKRQYGLEGTGLRAIEDEEAFTKQDITEFFSASAGPLVGGISASLAATGVGVLPAMAVAGAGGAIGYLMDEGFEYASGVQAEPIATVGRQAALEAVAAGLGEGGGRLLSAGLARLIKGPGGDAANAARLEIRAALAEGARPTVRAANTSPILGRLQAFYEGVFPNKAAAQQNADAVLQQIQKTQQERGITGEFDYASLRGIINKDIERIYGTPEGFLKTAEDNLRNVVDVEVNKLKNLFGAPDPRGARPIAETLDIAKRAFDEDVDAIYGMANQKLGRQPIVNVQPVKKALEGIIRDNPAMGLESTKFGRFVTEMPEIVDVYTANSLRTMLNQASFDPSLVGAVDKAMLTRMNNSLQEAFRQTEAMAAGVVNTKGPIRGADGRFMSKAEFAQMREGFDLLRKAQRFYTSGIDRFKQVQSENLFRKFRENTNFNPEDIVNPNFGLLVPNNGEGIRRFLNSVVPSGRAALEPPASLLDVVPDAQIPQPNGTTQSLRDVVASLPDNDPLKGYYTELYNDKLRFGQRIAQARGQGVETREAVRRQIAGMYLNRMFTENTDVLGRISAEKVSEKINALGSTARTLFGKQFTEVQSALKDMATLGRNIDERDLVRLAGMPITDQISAINSLTRQVKDLKGINLMRVLEQSAADGDANRVLNAVLKPNNVSAVKAAKDVLGDQSPTMELVRDLAVRDILAKAADGGDDFVTAVLSGKNAKAIETALNGYGRATLNELLGADVVDGLYALARFSRIASNEPITGLGGLSAAQAVQSLGALSFVLKPLETLVSIVGLQAMSKLLRTKAFLNLITRPTGVRPGAGVDYDQVGRALEMAWEITGQVSAQGVSQGQQAASQRVERMQQQVTTQGLPQVQMPTAAPTFQFTPPPRLRPVFGGGTGAGATAPRARPAELLGSNPIDAAKNAAIQARQSP